MVRKLTAFNYIFNYNIFKYLNIFNYLIINIILDYLKKERAQPLLQIYKEVFCKTSPLKLLNKILEKYFKSIFF